MATVRNLKIKISACKRIKKELHSYEKEVDAEAAKTADMKSSGADPYDVKQQENVLAESTMMVPDCHNRLQAALADLKGTLVSRDGSTVHIVVQLKLKAELEESGQKDGSDIDDARNLIQEVEMFFESS